jgi:hypothetical protein
VVNYSVLKPSVTVELDTWLFKDNNTKGLQSSDVEVLVEARADFKRTITAPVLDNRRLMYVSFDVILYKLD